MPPNHFNERPGVDAGWRVLLAFLLAGWSSAVAGSLSFEAPAGWETFGQSATDSHPLYMVRTPLYRNEEDRALLMFHPTLIPPKPKDVPAYVRELADLFAQYARTNASMSVSTTEYRIQQFSGAHCEGSHATFEFTNRVGGKFIQAVFAISVSGEVWNGQFTGPTNAWKQALAVLKSAKKND